MKQPKSKKIPFSKAAYITIGLAIVVACIILVSLFTLNNSQDSVKSLPDYVGLVESEARSKAANENLIYRDVSPDIDGGLTGDFRANRVNVTIRDNVVIKAERY